MGTGGVYVRPGSVTGAETARFTVGEVVDDCRIDVKDMVRVTAQYKAHPPFNPPCSDQDGDGVVTLSDVVIVAAAYGSECPTEWADRPESVIAKADGNYSGAGGTAGLPEALRGASRSWSAGSDRGLLVGAEGSSRTDAGRGDAYTLVAHGEAVYGWSAELSYDARSVRPIDSDPTAAGLQPFSTAAHSADAWIVENKSEGPKGEGRLLLAATLVAPSVPMRGESALASIEFEQLGSGSSWRAAEKLDAYMLLRSDGTRASGSISMVLKSRAADWSRLTLPWLHR